MNPNPVAARQTKRANRISAAGSIDDLRVRLWESVEAASDALEDADVNVRLRACHAMTQAAGAYAKLVEACEFEARLAAVERQLDGGRHAP